MIDPLCVQRASLYYARMQIRELERREREIARTGGDGIRAIQTQLWLDLDDIAAKWAESAAKTIRAIQEQP